MPMIAPMVDVNSVLPAGASVGGDLTVTGKVKADQFRATSFGSAAAPSFTWDGDDDNGFYRNQANGIGTSNGNANTFAYSQAIINVNAPLMTSQAGAVANFGKFRAEDDDAANPAFSYQGDPDTGMAKFGAGNANVLLLSTGGSFKAYFDVNETTFGTNNPILRVVSRHDYQGDISPSDLGATQEDWNPTGLSTASRIRASASVANALGGLAGGADGRRIRLLNIGSTNIVLGHDAATSTAANRFLCPGGLAVTLRPNGFVDLEYDSTSSRWRVMGA